MADLTLIERKLISAQGGGRTESVKVVEGSSLRAVWGPGNQLAVWDGGINTAYEQFWELSWNLNLNDLRELLVNWHSIFLELQTKRKSPHTIINAAWSDFVFEKSQFYRAALRTWITSPDNHLSDDTVKLVKLAESVWHLCEIMVVDPHENIANQMKAWLKDMSLTERLSPFEIYPSPERYLHALCKVIVRGDIQEALDSLSKAQNLWMQTYRESSDLLFGFKKLVEV
jgi:hypothetical protein